MAMAANDIERLIRARVPDAEVTIRDLAGDGDHYAATVIADRSAITSSSSPGTVCVSAVASSPARLRRTCSSRSAPRWQRR